MIFPLLAQVQTPAPAVHFLGTLADMAKQMMAEKVPLLLRLGWIEASLFAGFATFWFLIKTALAGRYHGIFDIEGFVVLIGRMLFVAILLSGYTVWSQLPTDFAYGLADYIGQGQMDPLIARANALTSGLDKPDIWNLIQVVFYFGANGEMMLIGLVMFALYSQVFQTIGVVVIYGPLFIPLLLTKHFERWFFRWVDVMIAAPMMIPTIAIYVFLWSNFLMNAFDKLFGGPISLASFAVTLGVTLVLLIGGLVFGAVRLGSTHSDLFAGSGSVGGGMVAGWDNLVRGIAARISKK
jgi:hypothetical protein